MATQVPVSNGILLVFVVFSSISEIVCTNIMTSFRELSVAKGKKIPGYKTVFSAQNVMLCNLCLFFFVTLEFIRRHSDH